MSKERIVKISSQAYNTILHHSMKYASSEIPRKDWKIVYGLLYGKIIMGKKGYKGKNEININAAIPITHGSSISIEFGEVDYLNITLIDQEISELGYFNFGWYHSHPERGLFLHQLDITNQVSYQALNPDSIALVYDCSKTGLDSRGIAIYSVESNELNKRLIIDSRIILNETVAASSGYRPIQWKIDQKLDEIKIEGVVLKQLRKKELGL